jgi:small subunit ribosomal protein S16
MVVAIRLQRFGRIRKPFYRIVVADSRSPRNGKFIERVGTFDPIADHNNVKNITLDVQRIKYWLSVGAQPSERVTSLLSKASLMPEPPRKYYRVAPVASVGTAAAPSSRGFSTYAGASGLLFSSVTADFDPLEHSVDAKELAMRWLQ